MRNRNRILFGALPGLVLSGILLAAAAPLEVTYYFLPG
jgi:hypothetical protein